jgi:hypothetical protein
MLTKLFLPLFLLLLFYQFLNFNPVFFPMSIDFLTLFSLATSVQCSAFSVRHLFFFIPVCYMHAYVN